MALNDKNLRDGFGGDSAEPVYYTLRAVFAKAHSAGPVVIHSDTLAAPLGADPRRGFFSGRRPWRFSVDGVRARRHLLRCG